jgi:RimJ/RimL family protein N-acetyltransferase
MPFRQPSLDGPTLRLRPLVPADRAALAQAASDPLIWEQHPDRDRWTEAGFARYFAGALASGGALAIREAATGRVVGSSRYDALDPVRDRVEIGWTFLTRDLWGGAANAELKRLMVDHALAHVGTVVFRIRVGNLRSRRAVEKLGARLEGTAPDDHVVYALPRDLWAAGA